MTRITIVKHSVGFVSEVTWPTVPRVGELVTMTARALGRVSRVTWTPEGHAHVSLSD